MKVLALRLIPLFLFIIIIGFFWYSLSLDPKNLPSAKLGKPLPKFSVSVLGNPNLKFSQNNLKGKISILNVWASWCSACVDEQIFLLQLAREGITIYGLNYKDNQDDAINWLSSWGNPYKLIGSDLDGKLAIDLGVYGAPETFLIDKFGTIRFRYAGILNTKIWQKEFMPIINEMEHNL